MSSTGMFALRRHLSLWHMAFWVASALVCAGLSLILPAAADDGSQGAALRQAKEQFLATAPDHGLEMLIRAPDALSPVNAAQEVMLRYVSALGQGAVQRDLLGVDWAMPQVHVDAAALLDQVDRTHDMQALAESLFPSDPQYRRLMAALARYRALERQGGWRPLDAGDVDYENPASALETSAAQAVRARLAAEGYITGPDQATAAAVRAFQRTHDLETDGRIGPKTLAALNVPASARLAQIAVNLERWRQLPRRVEARRIVVNIPGARLDVMDGGRAVMRMRVIDGDVEHPTPSFTARISAVTFNPPWNVPVSIARKEILPRLKRRPSYLAEQNIIIVDRPDDPFGRDIAWHDIRANVFPFRLRQLPGKTNALGAIKFEMAGPFDVYLHDTPARGLFARAERALSHGCVRVERPAELAQHLLADRLLDGHDATDIAAAIDDGATRTVQLRQPIPVYLQYVTVSVEDDGEIVFHPDIYKRDAALADALGFSRRVGGGPTARADLNGACG